MKKQYFLNAYIIDPKNSIDEIGGLIVNENGKISRYKKSSVLRRPEFGHHSGKSSQAGEK